MKILATTDLFESNDIGGAIRYYFDLLESLAARGHTVDSLLPCARDGECLREQYPGVRLHLYNVPAKGGPRELFTAALSRSNIEKLLNSERHDCIQLHQPKTTLGPMLLGAKPDVPVFYHFHSPWATEYAVKSEGRAGLGWWSRQVIESAYMKKLTAIIVLSEFMKSRLFEAHPGLKVPVHIVPGGVNTERFRPPESRTSAKDEAGFPQDRFVLFTARRFTPRTGLDMLVKAHAKLAKKHPELMLVMAGGGEQKAEIEAMVQSLGISDSVRFEGFIDESRLHVYYQAADLFVLPTRALEGFGLVSVEALACGTPVLGTPMGAITDVLKPFKPALLTREASVEAIEEGIEYWLERRDELEALGKGGREYVLNNFGWDIVAGKIEEVYREYLP